MSSSAGKIPVTKLTSKIATKSATKSATKTALRPRPTSKTASKRPVTKATSKTALRPRPTSKTASKMALRPRPTAKGATTLRARPTAKATTLRKRPSSSQAIIPGKAIEISEKAYRGSTNSDVIDPAYDLKEKKWYADFRVGNRFLRIYGISQQDVTGKVQAHRNATKTTAKSTVSNQLTLDLQQEKLDIRAALPRIGTRVKVLQKELTLMNPADPRFAVFRSELAEAQKALREKQLRIRKVDSQLKVLTRRVAPVAKTGTRRA